MGKRAVYADDEACLVLLYRKTDLRPFAFIRSFFTDIRSEGSLVFFKRYKCFITGSEGGFQFGRPPEDIGLLGLEEVLTMALSAAR